MNSLLHFQDHRTIMVCFLSVCFHQFSGTLNTFFFSLLALSALSASITPVPPKLKGELATKTKKQTCKVVTNAEQNTLFQTFIGGWVSFFVFSFKGTQTINCSNTTFRTQRKAQIERGGGGIHDFREQCPDASKDSQWPSLSDDKNG